MSLQINNACNVNFDYSQSTGNFTKKGYNKEFTKVYYSLDAESAHRTVERIQQFVFLLFETIFTLGKCLNSSDVTSQWRQVIWNKKEFSVTFGNEDLLKFNFPDRTNGQDLSDFIKKIENRDQNIPQPSNNEEMNSATREHQDDAKAESSSLTSRSDTPTPTGERIDDPVFEAISVPLGDIYQKS